MSAATLSVGPTTRRRTLVPVAQSNRRTLQRTKLSALNKLNGRPQDWSLALKEKKGNLSADIFTASVESTPLKRTISFDSEEENVKPYIKSEPTKRKRSLRDDEQLSESPKTAKASRTSPATAAEDKKAFSAFAVSLALGRPVGRDSEAKPKSTKAFGRRTKLTPLISEFARRNAAFASGKPIEPHRKCHPASWFFNIHVDTEVEEATNLMEHSACRLDISDGEGKKIHYDDRDKENIPPHELGITLPAAAQPVTMASRKRIMAPNRTPLSQLDIAEFLGLDLHAPLSPEFIQEDAYVKRASQRFGGALISPDLPSVMAVPKSLLLARQGSEGGSDQRTTA